MSKSRSWISTVFMDSSCLVGYLEISNWAGSGSKVRNEINRSIAHVYTKPFWSVGVHQTLNSQSKNIGWQTLNVVTKRLWVTNSDGFSAFRLYSQLAERQRDGSCRLCKGTSLVLLPRPIELAFFAVYLWRPCQWKTLRRYKWRMIKKHPARMLDLCWAMWNKSRWFHLATHS